MSVRRSASGDGSTPADFEPGQDEAVDVVPRPGRCSLLAGTGGRCGGMYAQWGSYLAPASIHCRSVSICAAVSGGFFESGGGIFRSGSSLVTRAISSLSSRVAGDDCRGVGAVLAVESQVGLRARRNRGRGR